MRLPRRARRTIVPGLERLDSLQLLSGFNIAVSPAVPNSALNATSAVAPNDIWAVGFSNPSPASVIEQPLVEHFDGTKWSVVASPMLPGGGSLRSVVALAANNVWAVGSGSGLSATQGGLIEHFDGTRWSVVPGAGSVGGILNSVTAISADDIWAVGQGTNSTNGSTRGNLIEHFDGTRWTAVPAPAFSFANDDLFGVSGDAANDVWAVGITGRSSAARTEVLHFNGTTWSATPAPTNIFATAITAISPTDVVVVGSSNGRAQVQTFNGTSWSVVATPSVTDSSLVAVTAVSADDIWAVGTSFSGGTERTLVEHFDGTKWSVVASPTPPPGSSIALNGVTAVRGANGSDVVVAVGSLTDANGNTSGIILKD